jgi:hypothetical protein
MSGSGFQLSLLRDSRLAPLATSALPAWLWSTDGNRIVWANAAGAAVFRAPTSAAIGSRQFTRSEPAPARSRVSPRPCPRRRFALERLRGFGAGIGRALTCACSHPARRRHPSHSRVALERAGPDLHARRTRCPLARRRPGPIAAFSTDGQLIAATAGAHAHLHGATSLAAIGADAPIAGALASGHAVARDAPQSPSTASAARLRRYFSHDSMRPPRPRRPRLPWYRRSRSRRRPSAAIRFASSGRWMKAGNSR